MYRYTQKGMVFVRPDIMFKKTLTINDGRWMVMLNSATQLIFKQCMLTSCCGIDVRLHCNMTWPVTILNTSRIETNVCWYIIPSQLLLYHILILLLTGNFMENMHVAACFSIFICQ